MSTDSDSGGCIRLVTVDKDGAHERFVQGDDVPLFQGASGPRPAGVMI